MSIRWPDLRFWGPRELGVGTASALRISQGDLYLECSTLQNPDGFGFELRLMGLEPDTEDLWRGHTIELGRDEVAALRQWLNRLEGGTP